jgi:hypothetical protein
VTEHDPDRTAAHSGDRAAWKWRRARKGALAGGDAMESMDAHGRVVAQNAARRAPARSGVEAISTRVVVEDDDRGIDRAFLDDGAGSSTIMDAAWARSSGWGNCPYGGSIIALRLRFWRRFG